MPASPATDGTGGVPAPGPTDRVLVLAPHPDDESIAAGGLLLAARRANAAVRVVFLTSGENNPWAQRAFERRLVLTARARVDFAGHREGEALAALAALGVEPQSVVFLRLPDQGLTQLLLRDPAGVCQRLAQELVGFGPTILVAPSADDLHPDHSATAVLTQLALLSQGGTPQAPTALAFLVHNPSGRRRLPAGLAMTPADVARKRAAIFCHASQLIWRRGFLPSFATPREGYQPFVVPAPGPPHPIAAAGDEDGALVVELAPRFKARAFGPATLLLLPGSLSHPGLGIPLSGYRRARAILDQATRLPVGRATVARRGGAVRVRIEPPLLVGEQRVFLKLERLFGFFDEAGWVRFDRPWNDGKPAAPRRTGAAPLRAPG